MRRVVVTGMGIVSSIGNNTQEVLASLREAKSGITKSDTYEKLGFRCQVHGAPSLSPDEGVDRRAMRFLAMKIDSANSKPIHRPAPIQPPNGLRVSGELRAEGEERVRCTRVLGST